MRSIFKGISNEYLEAMWQELEKKEKKSREDIDQMYMIRREMDRRMGRKKPTIEINFEKYVTK